MSGTAEGRVVRVETGSRLHFGLFDAAGVTGRRYGGVGMMIERPGVELELSLRRGDPDPAPRSPKRAAETLESIRAEDDTRDFDLCVLRCPDDHVGLGTGTQLGLAIAAAYEAFCDREPEVETLAQLSGRGRRSSIGYHGFIAGGFLIDGGKRDETDLSPLVHARDFPESWRIVLIPASRDKGLAGDAEQKSFDDLDVGDPLSSGFQRLEKEVEALSRLALLGMLPALEDQDIDGFGDALHEYGRRAGMPFRHAQGGIFASPMASDIVQFLRGQQIRGVGQSSWGPTLYAFARDPEEAEGMVESLCARFGFEPQELVVTTARNRGAVVEVIDPE